MAASPETPITNNQRPASRIDDDIRLYHRLLQHLSWVVIGVLLAIFAIVWIINDGFRDAIAEAWRVVSSGDQASIREYISSFGGWAPVASISLMVLQVVLAPIPASVIQLSNGVVFGIFGGALLNFIGQMAGATVAFFISRSLGRSTAERLAGRIDEHGVVEHWLDRWGARALLVVRMVPGMPSDFVSYLMGLTNMPVRRYLIVSAIGYIPQSLAYAWLGDYATDWFWWIILAGFGISSLIGLAVWIYRKHQGAPPRTVFSNEGNCDVS